MRSQWTIKSSFLTSFMHTSTRKIFYRICLSCHQEHQPLYLDGDEWSHGWVCCKTEVYSLSEISTFRQPTGFVKRSRKDLWEGDTQEFHIHEKKLTWFHSKHNLNGVNKNKTVCSHSFLSLEFQLLSCTDKKRVINLQSILISFDVVTARLASPPHQFSLTSWKRAGICPSQFSSNIAIILPLVQPPKTQNRFQ